MADSYFLVAEAYAREFLCYGSLSTVPGAYEGEGASVCVSDVLGEVH